MIYHFLVENDQEKYNNSLDSCLKHEDLDRCFLLHLISRQAEATSYLQTQADKLGYDIGFCDGETLAIYSSIFHEVLFGHIDMLISYKNQLNNNFLFPHREIAEKYVHLHVEISAQGKDVENIVEMTIYEVWRHKL